MMTGTSMPWSADSHRANATDMQPIPFPLTAVEQILSTSVLWVPLGVEVFSKILFPRAWNLDRINEHAHTKLCGANSSETAFQRKEITVRKQSSCRKLQEGGAIENKPDIDKELDRLKEGSMYFQVEGQHELRLEVKTARMYLWDRGKPSWLGQEDELLIHSHLEGEAIEDQTKPEEEATGGRWALVMAQQEFHPSQLYL